MKRICVFLICVFILSCAGGCDNGSKVSYNGTTEPEYDAVSDLTDTDGDANTVSGEGKTEETGDESDGNTVAASFEEMSNEEKRRINVFLSNFSEALYKSGNFKSEAEGMIDFACIHNKINNSNFKPEIIGDNYGISAELVDSTLQKYFGKTVLHETPTAAEQWAYEDGFFVIPAADGESYAYFSVATSAQLQSDGNYEVGFNVYFNSNDSMGSIDPQWYSMTDSEAQQYFEFCYDGKAVIRPDGDSYKLVSYETR